MTPEQEQLAQLRHRLIGLFYVICGDVRNASKGDRAGNLNHYSITVQEALAEVEKMHNAYAEFARAAVSATKAKEKK